MSKQSILREPLSMIKTLQEIISQWSSLQKASRSIKQMTKGKGMIEDDPTKFVPIPEIS